MKLHTHNHPFCFSTTIIHSFMVLKVYTLIAKLLCMEKTNKITASIACQMDKANLSQAHRLAISFIPIFDSSQFLIGNSYPCRRFFIYFYNHKVFIPHSYIASKKTSGEILVMLL